MADRRQIAAVFVGGAVGSLARATVSQAFPWVVGTWPWATFTVNVLGCAVLGYWTTRLQEQLPLSAYGRPLLGSGLCGGLTTFSTMQVELFRMIGAGEYRTALAYVSGPEEDRVRNADDLHAAQPSLPHRETQRLLCAIRSIHADHDGCHHRSLTGLVFLSFLRSGRPGLG
jgi:CrcB protein